MKHVDAESSTRNINECARSVGEREGGLCEEREKEREK